MLMLDFVKPGRTLEIPFESFASSTGAPITITGLAVGDIKIYKDGSTAERASTSGYTLLDTDGIDFDAITGIHGFSIDLSDNTTAGFYASGSRYIVVVSAVTVDSQTMSFLAARFTIGYPDAVTNTTIATLTTQTSFTLTVGPAEDDALNGCVILLHNRASAVQYGFAQVADYTGATKTVTLIAGVTFTAAAGDNVAIYPPAILPVTPGRQIVVDAAGLVDANMVKVGPTGSGTAQTARDIGGNVDAAITSRMVSYAQPTGFLAATFPTTVASPTNITAGTITTATNVTTVNGLAAGVITAASIAADAITDAKVASDVTIASVTGSVGSVTGAVGSVTAGVTVTTNNDKTGYGLSGAAVQAIWDALTSALTTVGSIGKYILDHVVGTLDTGTHVAQTGDSFARIGANGAGLTALGDTRIANLDGAITSRMQTYTQPTGFLAATFPATVASTTNITAGTVTTATNVTTVNGLAAGVITDASLAADSGLKPIRSNTAQAGAATTITLDASASAVDNFYNNALILLTGGTGAGQARFITGYVGATKVATVATWATTPDITTTFTLLPFDAVAGATAPTVGQIATAVWTDLLASSDFSTVASIGKLLKDDIDAAITSRMLSYTQPAGFLAATFPTTVASPTNITAGTITTATNVTTVNGLAANTITAASLATDAVTEIQAGLSTLDAAGVRTALGLAAANLDTQLGAIDDFLDTEVAAIKAKTDTIPISPAAIGSAMTLAAGALDAAAVATDAAQKLADVLLRRHQSDVELSTNGSALQIESLYGAISILGGQLVSTTANPGFATVYKTDGVTELGQIPLTTDPAGEPITVKGS